MNSSPNLAVVIVSWNVRGLLAACLRSLTADLESWGLDAEIWVVDNASSDGTPGMVEEMFPGVRLIANEENLGFVKGNNLALRQISGFQSPEHLWLLNPDTEVQPGATAALIAALAENPRAGMAGPKLLYPDGSLQHAAFRFPGLVQLLFEFLPLPARLYDTRLNGRYGRQLYEGTKPFAIDHPLGASMMVRAEAIADVGLMDEDFFMYCEEIDWCWRMQDAGWKTLCVPTAHVIHHAGRSSEQVRIPAFVNLWKSRARLYARHHGLLTRWLAKILVRAGMNARQRKAPPDMVGACQEIIQTWKETV